MLMISSIDISFMRAGLTPEIQSEEKISPTGNPELSPDANTDKRLR